MIFQGQQSVLTITVIFFSDPGVFLLNEATLDRETKIGKSKKTRSYLVG